MAASGSRDLLVRFLGDSSSAEKAASKVVGAHDNVSASSKTTASALADVKSQLLNLVPGGNAAEGALKKMTGASDGVGISLQGALVGGAAAAGVALASMAAAGVGKFASLTAEVSKFKNVTGATSEEASKFVAIAHGMGVDTDVLSAAMFKMGNVMAATPEKLTDVGIAIAKNKDGTNDMVGTLENAAQAWQNSTDATQKDAIAKAIGGKAGAAIIPILKQGSAAVREFAQAAKDRGEIWTDKDLSQGAEFRKSMREIGIAVDALEVSVAKGLVPTLTSSSNSMTAIVDGANKATSAFGGLGGVLTTVQDAMTLGTTKYFRENKKATDDVTVAIGRATGAERENADSTDALAESEKQMEADTKATSKAIDEQVKALENQIKASDGAASADISYSNALLATHPVVDAVTDAEKVLNDARRDHGVSSKEARDAEDALQKAINDGEQAYLDAAQAGVKLTQQHYEMAGQTYDAAHAHSDLIANLRTFAEQLDAGSPIRQGLQHYIDELNRIPSEVHTRLVIHSDESVSSDGVTFRASGGPASGLTVINEDGPEIVDLPNGSFVHNNAESRAMMAAAGGTTVNLYVTGTIVGTMQQFAAMAIPHIVNQLNMSSRRGTNMSAALGL